jgi:drug/metabolite transporter (DMT)-like permease
MSLVQAVSHPLAKAPAALQAAILMIVGCLFLSVLSGLIKYLSETGMHVFEIVFLRNLAGLIALAPWFLKYRLSGLRTGRPLLILMRGMTGFAAMLAWFYAITVIPLADAVALNFTAPLFGTILAIVVLKEVVRLRRWVAIVVGFAGAMIILRPGTIDMNPGAWAAVASAGAMAGSIICVKLLSRTESTPSIVAWAQIVILPLAFIPALLVWQMPDGHQLLVIAGMGVSATLGHLCFTRSYALAEATYVLPFDFFRLIFSAMIGFLFFTQVPDIFVWIGGAVIFASTIYIAVRESRMGSGKSARSAEATAAKLGQGQ